jgi:hypothetical protein
MTDITKNLPTSQEFKEMKEQGREEWDKLIRKLEPIPEDPKLSSIYEQHKQEFEAVIKVYESLVTIYADIDWIIDCDFNLNNLEALKEKIPDRNEIYLRYRESVVELHKQSVREKWNKSGDEKD